VRALLRRLHRWIGLASGLVVLIVGLTGGVFVWEKELFALAHPSLVRVTPGRARLPADSLWRAAVRALPVGHKPQQLTLHSDPARSVMLSAQAVDESRPTYFSEMLYYDEVYLNPYNGTVLGVIDRSRDWIWLTRMVHEHLLLGDAGTYIVGIGTLVFMAMCLAGVVLWWPRTRALFRSRLRPRLTGPWKRSVYDAHGTLGAWLFAGLLLIAATGPVWTWAWYEGAIAWIFTGEARVVGEPVPVAPPDDATGTRHHTPLDAALAVVQRLVPDSHRYTVAAGGEKGGGLITVSALYRRRSAWEEYERYYFSPRTAVLLGEETFDEKNLGMKWRNSNYGIHTGTLYGWPTQVLATILSLFAASLPVTGFVVWLPRWRRQRDSERRRRAEPMPRAG
jgi:uncharacterized iron-regulated membrane protein